MVQKNKICHSSCSGMDLAINQLAGETLIITWASGEKLFSLVEMLLLIPKDIFFYLFTTFKNMLNA